MVRVKSGVVARVEVSGEAGGKAPLESRSKANEEERA